MSQLAPAPHSEVEAIAQRGWTSRILDSPIPVAVVTAVLLIPFLNKPFHLDDTLFLRVAQEIRERPFAPYDLDYNWFYWPLPMWQVVQNPPLNSYFLAGIGWIAGVKEITTHAFYLIFSVGSAVCMYVLARRCCRHPALATLLTVVAPAFLVSAGNVMADVPLLFFWLMATVCVVHAADRSQDGWLWPAGVFATAAALTKYFGISVVPLLAVYWVVRTGRFRWHLVALGLPILGLLIWGAHSQSHGGVFHPLSAAGYAVRSKTVVTVLQTSADFLTFLGGTLLWPVMLLPVAFRLPMPYRIGFALLAIVGCIVGAYQDDAASKVLYAMMFMAGGMLLLVSVVSLIAKPDADSLLLGLWFWGTVVFCVFFNWTVNARIIVPAMFPATLLAIRWLETLERPQFWIRWARVAIVPTLGISVMVAIGDYTLASASKTFTQTVVRDLKNGVNRIFFCGHWGFQHYMELEGAEPLNHRNTYWIPGDLFVFPKNNTNVQPPQLPLEKLLVKPYANPCGFHTMGADVNAGFYSSDWGSLPFQFNTTLPVDRFIVARYTPQKPQEPTSDDRDEPPTDSEE